MGAGLAGLSAAIRLASGGHEVSVFEKNDTFGGKAGELCLQGYRFDTGPSLLTMPFVAEELFRESGFCMRDHLTIRPLDVICRYFYSDGTVINAYSDAEKFASELERSTRDDRQSLRRYLSYCQRIYELTSEQFLFKPFKELSTIFSSQSLKILFSPGRIDAFRSVDEANRSFFKDEKTIQLFDRYATYNGSNPFLAPATLNIIPYVEYVLGGYVVEGGMRRLAEALFSLAEKLNVRFYFNTPVESIMTENKAILGIRYNSREYFCDAVVSNIDVNFTYTKLLGRKIKSPEPSGSAVVFYWCIDRKFEELETHNILFSSDYRKEFLQMTSPDVIPDDPTVYIYISSKFSPLDAPEGCENWFVLINTSYDRGYDWDALVKKARASVIRKIRSALNVDINDHITAERTATPAFFLKEHNSYKGSIYGYSSNSRSAAFLREANRSRKIKGLYFAGGSSHPGGGVPLAILSGMIAASQLRDDRRRKA